MTSLKDSAAKVITGAHRGLLHATQGRFGKKVMGMDVVELTTTGRKSGQRRTTMLTSPVHDDRRVVVIASYGGDDRHPAWYLNLREHPEVTVTIGGQTREMVARTATPDEKAELWPQVVKIYNGYAGYQKRTDRDIPVVILEAAP